MRLLASIEVLQLKKYQMVFHGYISTKLDERVTTTRVSGECFSFFESLRTSHVFYIKVYKHGKPSIILFLIR